MMALCQMKVSFLVMRDRHVEEVRVTHVPPVDERLSRRLSWGIAPVYVAVPACPKPVGVLKIWPLGSKCSPG